MHDYPGRGHYALIFTRKQAKLPDIVGAFHPPFLEFRVRSEIRNKVTVKQTYFEIFWNYPSQLSKVCVYELLSNKYG